jgi:hypothetical protein
MNRFAKGMTAFAASAVVVTGALAAAPVATAQTAAPEGRTNVHFSARTDRVLERAHVTTTPTGTARLTTSANEPSVISFKVVRKNRHLHANNGGIRFRAGDGNLALGHWSFNTNTRKVNATINKSARATFFRLKHATNGPADKYRVVFNNLGAGQFNAILNTKTFEAGDTFGRVILR